MKERERQYPKNRMALFWFDSYSRYGSHASDCKKKNEQGRKEHRGVTQVNSENINMIEKMIAIVHSLLKDYPNEYKEKLSEVEIQSIKKELSNSSFLIGLIKKRVGLWFESGTETKTNHHTSSKRYHCHGGSIFEDIFLNCSHGFRVKRETQIFFASVQSWGRGWSRNSSRLFRLRRLHQPSGESIHWWSKFERSNSCFPNYRDQR